jgi:ABC-type maltose transport system permease subunit
VTNTGNAALSVTGISFAGANPTVFAYTTTCGQSLAVGSACTISVVFTPTSIGYAWAKLKVTGSKNTQTAIVNGTGN